MDKNFLHRRQTEIFRQNGELINSVEILMQQKRNYSPNERSFGKNLKSNNEERYSHEFLFLFLKWLEIS